MKTGEPEMYRESTTAFKTQNTFQTQEVHVNKHGSSKQTHMCTGKTQIWEEGGEIVGLVYMYMHIHVHIRIYTHTYTYMYTK